MYSPQHYCDLNVPAASRKLNAPAVIPPKHSALAVILSAAKDPDADHITATARTFLPAPRMPTLHRTQALLKP